MSGGGGGTGGGHRPQACPQHPQRQGSWSRPPCRDGMGWSGEQQGSMGCMGGVSAPSAPAALGRGGQRRGRGHSLQLGHVLQPVLLLRLLVPHDGQAAQRLHLHRAPSPAPSPQRRAGPLSVPPATPKPPSAPPRPGTLQPAMAGTPTEHPMAPKWVPWQERRVSGDSGSVGNGDTRGHGATKVALGTVPPKPGPGERWRPPGRVAAPGWTTEGGCGGGPARR